MRKIVDYHFAPNSPWSFLGHSRLLGIASRHAASVAPKPVDFGRIFPATGGLPLPQHAKARRDYRMVELRRWRDHLGIEFNLEPKFSRTMAEPAARLITAAEAGGADALTLAGAVMRAVWVEERDIADRATPKAIVSGLGHDADELLELADSPESEAAYRANTDRALAAGVFGAPTYVYRDEMFWSQDRLDFLDRALAD